MKLLLIQPPSSLPLMDRIFLFEPLALEYLGAAARLDGHEVKVLDARLEPDVEAACAEFRPDAVGLTAFTSHVNIVKGIARRLKERREDVKVIVGGHHATVRPEDFDVPAVDAVVVGEGTAALREILRAWAEKKDLQEIEGLAIPRPGGMCFAPPRRYTPLDDLPFPDRGLTARYRANYFSEWFKPLASVRTSLGCTARCTFCSLWSLTGGKYLRRDPQRVVEELRRVAEPNVFFCDDESMCDVRRMGQLADRIREAGIRKRYFLYARVDTIVDHPDLFARWAEIGLAQRHIHLTQVSPMGSVVVRGCGLPPNDGRVRPAVLERGGLP